MLYTLGRAWTYQELSVKSFDDLHKLYWVCIKEQNRTLTAEKERRRVRAGYGGLESDERVEAVSPHSKRLHQAFHTGRYACSTSVELVERP